MNLKIISYNDVDLNNDLFEAYFPVPSVLLGPDVDIGEVERQYFAPISTYKKRKSKMLFIHVKMLGTLASDIDTLNALFNPYDPDFHELVCEDQNDDNKRYYVMGTPANHPSWDGQELVVGLKVDDPIWKTEQEIETTWSITTDGDQESVAIGGSFYSEPTLEITPTSAKSGGNAYRIFCPVYNQSTTIEYTDYPIDIVNNALDTTALVADSTRTVDLNGGVNDSVTTFDYDGESGTFPTSGIAYIDTEQFSYTGKSGTQLTGITRGVNGTSAAAHLDDAVIYASTMEADGGDIQVTVDGIQDNYWLQDINNATTQVWINIDLSPGYAMTNGIAIADSGAVTTITLENSTANITAINALPTTGCVLIDNELFTYTGKNVTTRKLTGVTRSAHSTAAAAHIVGDNVWWIEHDIYIYHGVHDLPSFTVSDLYKPFIELDSTNAAWEWDATFASVGNAKTYNSTRTATWRVRTPIYWDTVHDNYDRNYSNESSFCYYESMDTTAPSAQTSESNVTFSVMGEYFVNTGYWPIYGWIGATTGSPPSCFYSQSGFTHVAATGKRYLSSAAGTDWYLVAATKYMFRVANTSDASTLEDFTDFSDAFSVAAPAGTDASDPWTQATLDLSGTYNYILFYPQRDNSNKDGEVRIEVDTFTMTNDSTTIPVAAVGSSIEYYHINSSLINTTTGDYIDIDHYLDLNETLVINTSDRTVIDENTGTYERGSIALSTYRPDWLKLESGLNTLQWDEDNVTGVTVAIKRRERKL